VPSRKARVKKELIHVFIPSLRSLLEAIEVSLEAIEASLEATDKIGVALVKSRRLFHINFFL
jgi:hypothetical protein